MRTKIYILQNKLEFISLSFVLSLKNMNHENCYRESLLRFLSDRYKSDNRVFSLETFQKLSTFITDLIDKETPLSATVDTFVKFEERGKICGFPFNKGDIIYRCRYFSFAIGFRECGRDPTCVFCAQCFNEDDHAGHEISYSITCSSGGCCDCGDSEAWNVDLKCSVHSKEAFDSNASCLVGFSDFLDSIRPSQTLDLIVTFVSLFPIFSLYYAHFDYKKVQKIIGSSFGNLDAAVCSFLCGDGFYSTLLYNDELHSFDDVIRILSQVYGYPRPKGRELAEIVDKKVPFSMLLTIRVELPLALEKISQKV